MLRRNIFRHPAPRKQKEGSAVGRSLLELVRDVGRFYPAPLVVVMDDDVVLSPAYKQLDGSEAAIVIGYDPETDFIADAAWLERRFPDQRFAFRNNSQVS
jgi:hypothetical protein